MCGNKEQTNKEKQADANKQQRVKTLTDAVWADKSTAGQPARPENAHFTDMNAFVIPNLLSKYSASSSVTCTCINWSFEFLPGIASKCTVQFSFFFNSSPIL